MCCVCRVLSGVLGVQGAVPLRGKGAGSWGFLHSARPTDTVSRPRALLKLLVLRQLQVGHVGSTEQTCGSNLWQ